MCPVSPTARLPLAVSSPSLMNELKTADCGTQHGNEVKQGWRTLGSNKIWRSDWTEYDIRKRRNIQQQKARDKAIKRRKAHKKKQWNRNNNGSNINTRQGFSGHQNDRCNYKSNNNNNFGRSNISNKMNYANHNDHHNIQQNSHRAAPTDRDLLAAAKVAFSGPPVVNPRWIRFQRGEILNPYPQPHRLSTEPAPANSSTSCEACAHNHSCFRKN